MPLNLIQSLQDPAPHRHPGLLAEVALAESNHRIANSLSLVGGLLHLMAAEVARTPGPHASRDVAAFLDQASDRIQTVGRLHRLLSEAGTDPELDLSAFLREITEATAASLAAADRAQLSFAFHKTCPVPAGQALPIGLIVSELIANSLKYAHPAGVAGQIEVSCRRRGPAGDLFVEVRDDGVGLPEGFDPSTARSLGLRLVHSLASQVGGQLHFEQTGVGLSVTLSAPGAL